MYRSRMPYTRWHAKAEQIKERMKKNVIPNYYRIQSNRESSEESESSSSEQLLVFGESERENRSKASQEEGFDASRYKREPIKPIREQIKEFQKKKTTLGFGTQSERFWTGKQDYVRRQSY